MGEIADSMIDGTFDCITGEYIGDPCGYPRTNNYNKKHTKKDVIRVIVNKILKPNIRYSTNKSIQIMDQWILTTKKLSNTSPHKIQFTLNNQNEFKEWLLLNKQDIIIK